METFFKSYDVASLTMLCSLGIVQPYNYFLDTYFYKSTLSLKDYGGRRRVYFKPLFISMNLIFGS